MNYSIKKSTAKPRYSSADEKLIDVLVSFDHLPGLTPYTASPDDTSSMGREIYARCRSGEFGEVAPFTADPEREQSLARVKRNALLKQSDWTQLSDSPLTPAQRKEWKEYRQALRDMPAKSAEDEDSWPMPPG